MAAGHLRHQIGGGRRYDDEVGVAGKPDVADVKLAALVEQLDINVPARQRAGRQRRDELVGGVGHHHAHVGTALTQPADQVERLVCRDPAADDEEGALAVQRTRVGDGHLFQR